MYSSTHVQMQSQTVCIDEEKVVIWVLICPVSLWAAVFNPRASCSSAKQTFPRLLFCWPTRVNKECVLHILRDLKRLHLFLPWIGCTVIHHEWWNYSRLYLQPFLEGDKKIGIALPSVIVDNAAKHRSSGHPATLAFPLKCFMSSILILILLWSPSRPEGNIWLFTCWLTCQISVYSAQRSYHF